MSIYLGIRSMVPIVNVFLELGREGETSGRDGVRAYRLIDILHHTRLPSLGHLAACLQVIDDTFRRIRGDDRATLYAVDDRGTCFIAAQTQQSIMAVWQQLVAGPATLPDSRPTEMSNERHHAAAPARTAMAAPIVSAHFDEFYPSLYNPPATAMKVRGVDESGSGNDGA